MNHEPFIHRTLELAEHGRGRIGNGALVGAVLVEGGRILAEGFHAGFGNDHAEVNLIKKIDQKIPLDAGLYVNLEPCAHYGKTPPCTKAIIQAGIKRVIYGMQDPDLRTAGKGIEQLRLAGIEIIGPVLPEVCRRFNRGFVSARKQGRPWITVKQAFTKSGIIANPDGSRLKITNPEQDEWSHANLRAKHDAILVGVGTIECDDPSLTVRLNAPQREIPQPYRIILDPDFRIPHTAKVLNDAFTDRTIVVTAKPAGMEGVRTIDVPMQGDQFDWKILFQKLMKPEGDFYGITSILVEGGKGAWQRFFTAGLVDEHVTLVGA